MKPEILGSIYGGTFALLVEYNQWVLDGFHALIIGGLGALGGFIMTKYLKKYWR